VRKPLSRPERDDCGASQTIQPEVFIDIVEE
jgi:hypothetical protein